MQMMKKSLSNDQDKYKILCDLLCDNIDDLLSHFEITYKHSGKMVSMACPIHQGDNSSALNLYVEGDSYRGNWKCRTHQCEKTFKGSIIGFIRGLLSYQKHNWSKDGDKMVSFEETIQFVSKFLNKDLSTIKICKVSKNKNTFTNAINQIAIQNNQLNIEKTLNREKARSLLDIPSEYYLNRGFSKSILDKYDVGLCTNPKREMYNRTVVPIYDLDHEYVIGCTGRSIFEKCPKCSYFHNHQDECPSQDKLYLYSKWKHSLNFKSQNSLYNIWFAKKHIQETGIVILVESPGNVWKLEENNIHNSVGIFGCSLSDKQKMILDSTGAMTIILLMDNDEAGRKASAQIKEKCENTYKVYCPEISKNDIAEMTPVEIEQQIKTFIRNIIL